MVKVITVIPAYNEENTIAEVIKGAKQYSEKVIVIDDGSVDATRINALKAGASVISNKKNKGLGACIRRGYYEAFKEGADVIVQIDADGQYTVSDIPKLVKPIISGNADMVIASRFLGGIEEMPFMKRAGNRIFTFLTSVMIWQWLSDAQSGFRAVRRGLVKKIIPSEDRGYTHETIIKAARNNARIVEVPSYFKRRRYGESRLILSKLKYALREGRIMLRTILK